MTSRAVYNAFAMTTFVDELKSMIAARRSFGGHPLWHAIAAGRVSPLGLRSFASQFFLQVREFPRAVSALHANCPFPEERQKLAESVYEEETGRISGCNLPHPELFIVFGCALGLARAPSSVTTCTIPTRPVENCL